MKITREVFMSMDKKNWIFAYSKVDNQFYNLMGKKVGPVEAHLPIELFHYAKIVDKDQNGAIVKTEIRDLR